MIKEEKVLIDRGAIMSELKQLIADQFNQLKQEMIKPQPSEFLTRKELKDMLGINYSTVHAWCQQGRLNPYGIGRRVYFKREEVDACLTPLNNKAW